MYQVGGDLREEFLEQHSEGEARDPSPDLEARKDLLEDHWRLHVSESCCSKLETQCSEGTILGT